MNKQPQCPKCGQPMLEGYVPEASQSRAGGTRWVSGPPEVGFLGLNLRGKDVVEIRTFRCAGCGYLESYAWKQALNCEHKP
jgi:predicted nucleic-acid-binding Zn-ribbon protein